MNRIKHAAVALAAISGASFILTAVVIFLVPPLIDKSFVGNKIRREISALVEGDFNYDRLDIAVFPSPHAVLVKPQVTVPDQFSASVETIELYPDIFASLTGHITIDRVAAIRPETTVWISEPTDGAETAHLQFNGSKITRSVLKMLSRLPVIDHGTVSQGRITIVHGQTTTVFENFDAELQNGVESVNIEATATSELVKKITLQAEVRRRNFEGNARLDIGGLDLGAVTTILSPASSIKVEDGKADLGLSFGFHGDGNIVLDINCSAPQIRLSKAAQMTNLNTLKITGTAQMGASATDITISDFHLGKPALRLAGNAAISDAVPRIRFALKGRDIDIGSSRSASLAMAGSTHAVKTVFNILKDGTISALSLSGQADSPRDLADLNNLVLRASLSKGMVFIPGAEFELADVSGQVGLSKGILTGDNIAAHWQRSKVHQGKFEIDLKKDPLAIDVATKTSIQAADVPGILKTFITNKTFSDELDKIEDLSGKATGNLSLSGDIEQLAVAVSASEIKVSARHRSLPFPLKVSDGALSYENEQLQIKSLSGSLGTSAFAELSGTIGFGSAKTFSITSGTSRIVIKDILPWLSSFKPVSRITAYYGGGKSILNLTKAESSGSLDDLSHVQFNLTGDLHDLTIKNLPSQPAPLAIASMRLSADQKTLTFADLQAHMLDGSVNISGKYPDYLSLLPEGISLSFVGRAGPQLIGWINDIGKLPPWLNLRPLIFRKSYLTYAFEEGHQISAAFALQDDLEFSTDLKLAQDVLAVNSLKLQDHLSKASFTARKAGKLMDFTFEGALHNATVNKLTNLPMVQSGSLDGQAKISLNLANNYDIKLLGELSGKQISILSLPEAPLILKEITVKGVPEGIDIESADLSWSGASVKVAGTIWPKAGAVPKLALRVEADTLKTDTMMKTFSSRNHKSDAATDPRSIFSLFDGGASFKANSLTVLDYAIQKLAAEVRFPDDKAEITVKEAVFCTIPVNGTMTLNQQQISYHAEPIVDAQNLSSIVDCLFDKQLRADGILDFTGSFDGHGAVSDLAKSTTGQAEIRISEGRVYRDIIILNVLKFLNASEVLTGQVRAKNMTEKGVGFDRIEVQVKLDKGKLLFERFIFDGEEFKLSGSGHMDILEKRLDFTLLAAPLKTSSTVLEHIPLIGGILETLDTIPLRVNGTFENVHFLPLAPSAVKDELLDIMNDAVDIPVKLVHLNNFNNTN